MKVLRPAPAHRDSRGSITDILEGEKLECLTLLTCRAGSVRGNHYHKKTVQYTYVLEGRLRLFVRMPGGPIRRRVVRAGDLVVSPPLEQHAFRALVDSRILAFCTGPRAGRQYESDTFRLAEPISNSPRGAESQAKRDIAKRRRAKERREKPRRG